MYKEVEVMQVIRTRLLRRGTGKEPSPIRIIEQYWTMEGDLIFEVDPCPAPIANPGGAFTPDQQ
jgi:hypothetical protein